MKNTEEVKVLVQVDGLAADARTSCAIDMKMCDLEKLDDETLGKWVRQQILALAKTLKS